VQLDPIKPTLTAPGTKRLKVKCNGPVANFAFKFYLRRYIKACLYITGHRKSEFDTWAKVWRCTFTLDTMTKCAKPRRHLI